MFEKIKKFFKFLKTLNRYEEDMKIRKVAMGMNSSVDITEDLHIVMLDYDVKDIEKVVNSVWELQQFWNLSDAYIYKTKNGHHVFFWFDQVPYARLRMIVDFAKYVDPMFKAISKYYDHKTIRVAGKYDHDDIEFVKKIPGVREPSKEEVERGSMKRKEHGALSN